MKNLADLRKESGLKQKDLAEALDITQARVSRYEARGDIPIDLLKQWAYTIGCSIDDLLPDPDLPAEKETIFDFNNSLYGSLTEDLKLLEQYIDRFLVSKEELPDESVGLTIEQFRDRVTALKEKPWVVITGRFDAGKTHFCNFYLEDTQFPTGYRPVTRYPTFIRHISDRPEWFQADLWLMGPKFDPEKWDNEDHCTDNKVFAGSWNTLEERATLKGRKDNNEEGAVLAFVDAPLLHSCVLVDLPGYDDDMTNESIINRLSRQAAILLYLCPVQGFLGGGDFARLAHLLRGLPRYEKSPEELLKNFPTLGNLFIIATHAHPGITTDQLEDEILRGGSEDFYEHFKENLLSKLSRDRQSISLKDVQARFFSFYQEIPRRRERLEYDLKLLLGEKMPPIKKEGVNEEILRFKDEGKDFYAKEIDKFNKIRDEKEKAKRHYERLKKEEPDRKKGHDREVKRIEQEITKLRDRELENFRAVFEEETEVEKIEDMIKKRYKGDRKKAEKHAAAYVLAEIQSKTEDFRRDLLDEIKELIDSFMRGIRKNRLLEAPQDQGAEEFSIPFDAKGAFLGGLAGLGTLGALGAWAATLGSLGGYILVAKGVSVLSTIGISFAGGTAGAVALVSALGGPITLAIGVALAVGALSAWLFGDSWERRLAKKIMDVFKKEDVLSKIEKNINSFWEEETLVAFQKGAENLNRQYKNHIKDMKDAFGGSQEDLEALEKRLERYEEIKSFFAAIPWR